MADPIVDALELLLTTDPEFILALQALNLGSRGQAAVPKVLRSNRRFEQIGQENYPCFVVDAGDGTGEDASNEGFGSGGMTLGSCSQDWTFDYDLAFVWVNQDHAPALAQRHGIRIALTRLLLRNPSLGETATWAYIASAANDSNQRHPTHFSSYVLRVSHTIDRDD